MINAQAIEQALTKFSQVSPLVKDEIYTDTGALQNIKDWPSAQASFEKKLLSQLYPLFPTTRKLANRLNVSHNKIAMKLRKYDIR